LLGGPELYLDGVLLVLRLGLAAQFHQEHVAIGLLAGLVTDLSESNIQFLLTYILLLANL